MTKKGFAWQKIYKNYWFRTLLQNLITVFAVITFIFFLVRMMPGNPLDNYIDFLIDSENLSYEDAYNQAAAQFDFDPNANIVRQYFGYLNKVLHGDLGESLISSGTKVTEQIAQFLPWTIFTVGLGLLISFTLGMLGGTIAAYFRNTWVDNVFSIGASILDSVPDYIWGLFIIIVFGVKLKWFDVGLMRGTYGNDVSPGFNIPFLASALYHASLPVLTYSIARLGGWTLAMRGSTISTLGEDYVNIARARGLRRGRIITSYVGRNATLPLVTLLALYLGLGLGGSVIVENLFVYNGLGRLLTNAIYFRDYTSMQGILLIITVAVIFSNMLADLLYGFLDPRVTVSGEK